MLNAPPPLEMGEFTYDIKMSGRARKGNVYLVDYSMEPLVGQNHADPDLYTAHDLIAESSVSSLMKQMTLAKENSEYVQTPSMMEFDHSRVGPIMLQSINEIVAGKASEVANV